MEEGNFLTPEQEEMMDRAWEKFWKIAIFIIVLFLFLGGCLGLTCSSKPGYGEKIGQIVKVSYQGQVNPTWEAQLIRGGMNSGSGSFGTEPFNFTITDPQAAETVKKYMHERTEVIVAYRIPRTYLSCHSDSQGYFMTSIEPAATNKSEAKSEASDVPIENSANI